MLDILIGFSFSLLAIFLVVLCWALHSSSRARSQEIAEANKRDALISANLSSAIEKIRGLVDEHIETLARRRLALVRIDHYGIVDNSAWAVELQRFFEKVVAPKLTNFEARLVAIKTSEIISEQIETRVQALSDKIKADLEFSSDMTPALFEQWSAKTLASKGWNAIVTKASGDQGADVLAEKGGLRVILQCKLYDGAVGNKAVQEAFAARRHYAANASAVVTNARYTPSAQELAKTTGVLLLHYSDLDSLENLLIDDD